MMDPRSRRTGEPVTGMITVVWFARAGAGEHTAAAPARHPAQAVRERSQAGSEMARRYTENRSAAALSEALVFNFAVVKAVAA